LLLDGVTASHANDRITDALTDLMRMRSKPGWVWRCAKRISTRFRSSRDLANAFVFMFRRATSRASSWRSRGILRDKCIHNGTAAAVSVTPIEAFPPGEKAQSSGTVHRRCARHYRLATRRQAGSPFEFCSFKDIPAVFDVTARAARARRFHQAFRWRRRALCGVGGNERRLRRPRS
jgi:hypothetical protein